MSLVKRTYVDQVTVITAENLNAIQDEIIANGTAIEGKIGSAEKGEANGVAGLDSTGKVPSAQIPASVNDVLEYNDLASFPSSGVSGKIYVAKDTGKIYRWTGAEYAELSQSLALGETSGTAYRGDRGKTAYDDSQANKANIGTMANLTTTEKGSLVGAVNELDAGKYEKPSGGIPSTDMTSAVQTSLGKADSAYQKPSGGIPASDMASGVQTSLGKADTAYQKPSGGIPSTDMASAVQTSLGKADSAYQKPQSGIPSTDLASAVQTSLEKADTALQSSDIDSTLTVTGKAADAKKTGDEISDVKNTLNQLIQESAFEIVEENGEFKLYWYGAQGECPYTIVYENGVYNLYFNYTTA